MKNAFKSKPEQVNSCCYCLYSCCSSCHCSCCCYYCYYDYCCCCCCSLLRCGARKRRAGKGSSLCYTCCGFQPQSLVTGRVLGGGSTINLMNYERGDHKDYDTWENEFGADGWNAQSMFDYFVSDENNSDYSISGENLASFALPLASVNLHFACSFALASMVRDELECRRESMRIHRTARSHRHKHSFLLGSYAKYFLTF